MKLTHFLLQPPVLVGWNKTVWISGCHCHFGRSREKVSSLQMFVIAFVDCQVFYVTASDRNGTLHSSIAYCLTEFHLQVKFHILFILVVFLPNVNTRNG